MSANKRQRFIDVFNGVRDELVEHFASENMPADAQDWFRRVCDRNDSLKATALTYILLVTMTEFGLEHTWREAEPWIVRRRHR